MSPNAASNYTNRAEREAPAAANEQPALPPQGLEAGGVGRLTKEPYVGKDYTKMNVAFSRNFKDKVTGEWRQTEPTYANVVLEKEAHSAAPKLAKGDLIQVSGPLETRTNVDEATNREFKNLTITAFGAESFALLKRAKANEGLDQPAAPQSTASQNKTPQAQEQPREEDKARIVEQPRAQPPARPQGQQGRYR